MGTQRTIITSVLQVPSNHNEIPESQNYLDSRIKSCFPGYPKSKRNSRGIPEKSVKPQKKPRDIEFYDENGSPVIYRIQHDDNLNDTCNDFYPIHCQQGNNNNVLRLHNDGENFTLNSLSNEFPPTTIQSATDCFRLGKTINQFRRLCLPSTQSSRSVGESDPTYSSIDSSNTNEDDDALAEPNDDDDNPVIDDDEDDNFICEINIHADHYRLCKAKAAHDTVLGKIDASFGKETTNSY